MLSDTSARQTDLRKMSIERRVGEQFYGNKLAWREVTGFRFTVRHYSPDFETPLHTHQAAYLCLVLKGTSRQTYGKKSHLRKPLEAFFYPPGETLSERFGNAGGRFFVLEVSKDWMSRVSELAPQEIRCVSDRRGALAQLGIRLYHEFRRPDTLSSLTMEGLAIEVLAEAVRAGHSADRTPPSWLVSAREILRARFADRFSLCQIADAVRVHPVYLATMFRRFYGCSVGTYVRRLRITAACDELSRRKTPLVEIALETGFSNQAHFSREFRRAMGVTPREFRAEMHRDGTTE
jgi:AraC family transcriptional regulator